MIITETEPPPESIDDEFDSDRLEDELLEEYWIEMAENEEARGLTERTFELAKKAMDETFQKHPEKCKRIIEIIEKYDCTRTQWNTIEIECLLFKLSEIYETLHDFYFILVSAKYNSARILLRKWIELIVVSIYFDTTGKNDSNRQKFLDAQQIGYSLFSKSLKKLQCNSINKDKIKILYQKLSLYTHNEGEICGQFLPFYHEKEFKDIYLQLNDIQSLMERMIADKYNINI